MIYTREQLEQREADTLAPYAVLAAKSRGRSYAEGPSQYRTAFQKDRDRVIHTSAFRRLEYKTQVFVNYEGDHYRTRLTHTLEVAQVAKSITRALGLNDDLAETIALAHDLGHPPFGHAGERTLDRLASAEGGFDHNQQSLRVVTELEHRYPAFPGLNLSWETLEGIMKHDKYDLLGTSFSKRFGDGHEPDRQPSLEAQVVNIADELAYNAHDLEDGLRGAHLTPPQIAEVPLVGELMKQLGLDAQHFGSSERYILIRELLGLTIESTIRETDRQLSAYAVKTLGDVQRAPTKLVCAEPDLHAQLAELKSFLYENLYYHFRQIRMTRKADRMLTALFTAYCETPKMLPQAVQAETAEKGLVRTVTDYLAGMTDRYAGDEYRKLFDPQALT